MLSCTTGIYSKVSSDTVTLSIHLTLFGADSDVTRRLAVTHPACLRYVMKYMVEVSALSGVKGLCVNEAFDIRVYRRCMLLVSRACPPGHASMCRARFALSSSSSAQTIISSGSC